MNYTNDETIELCLFKLADGATDSDFLSANEQVSSWLKDQPGFKFRCLSKKADSQWVDIVHWQSADAARTAGDKFMQELGDSAFFSLLDPETVDMSHCTIQSVQVG